MPSESKSKPKLRSTAEFRAFLAVFLVAVVGVATIGLPVVYGGSTTTVQAAEPSSDVETYETASQAGSAQVGSGLDPADDVYLRDDGSAVLRYDQDSNADRTELGMDVSEGLIHMLVVDDIENGDSEVEAANFSAILDENGFASDGSLVMQQPDELDDLTVDASGEITDETNRFDASATGSFQSGATGIPEVETSGEIAATADRLETSGTVSVDGATGGPSTGSDEGDSIDVSLDQSADGYSVDVDQERTVSSWSASQWETRSRAEQALQQQYGSLATQMGGTSEIEISSYDFEESRTGQYRLDLEFTVEYTGIDNGIEEQLTDQLANNPETELTRAEAEEIATSVTDLEIETFEFAMRESGGSMDAEWTIALANYDELTLSLIDLAEASSTGEAMSNEDLENARTSIEAQQEADLKWTLEWDGSAGQTSSQGAEFDVDVSSNTENWDAYVDELEANGIETQNDLQFSLTADADGDVIDVNGQFEVEAEDLASQAIKGMAQSAQSGPTTTTSSEADRFVTALAESELEVARVDANIGDGTMRVEAGAKFENMSKMTDTFGGDLSIGGIATESGDSSSVYVYVDDMGDIDTASATKADIEHLRVVGSETTVHAAGEWDEEFPEPDTEKMNEFLNRDSGEGGESDDDGSDSIPGFGIGLGLASIAGLLTALVLRQRE